MSEPKTVWTIREVLGWTTGRFASAELPTPRLDAEVLLAHVLGVERIQLYLDFDKPLGPPELARYREAVRRRLTHEPVAYVTGRREFWSLAFEVSPAVLIPRPETELLVELGLDHLRRRPADAPAATVVEVGAGSGAIAVTIAHERPDVRVLAIERSPEALEVARRNVARHAPQVELLLGDLLEPLPEGLSVDLLLANLPYIPSAELETLAPEVRGFEPRIALDGGPDGLALVRPLVAQGVPRLAAGGLLALELDPAEVPAVRDLLAAAGLVDVRVVKDLAGRERVVRALRPA
ncbi:MAG: peptide chain release factor N(5)-glutamine methyltransferase [Deltaproteobacteria bacterium]|nr:peptide chain release factor N(5)-glutamine methyltransferase [Deltaproteobacteria bacterium]